MKKYFIFAVAAVVAMASCAKVNPETGMDNNGTSVETKAPINFQVANYVAQTKASGAKYEGTNFGTYAWFNGSTEFMVNEKVGKKNSTWTTTDHTFYWPKTGSIDFISYSPFAGTSNTAGTVPVVTSSSITYTNYTVGTDDLMYADKVTATKNVNEITDDANPESGFSGVPTLFHHALAKVSFKIKANFLSYGTDPDITTWEIKVSSLKISGFKTTGSCALTWDSENKKWTKPTNDIWTSPSGASSAQELIDSEKTLTTEAVTLNSATGYVLPQDIVAGAQKLTISYTIKTTLANGKEINETITNQAIDLVSISNYNSWKMNDNIVYTINIKPTSKADVGGHDDDPLDVIITFDPAVDGWNNVNASATIQI